MSDQPIEPAADWPRTCPVCGSELASHVTGFTPAATAEGEANQEVAGAVVAEDFCPNPDCPARQENAPGSVGGDNGGG